LADVPEVFEKAFASAHFKSTDAWLRSLPDDRKVVVEAVWVRWIKGNADGSISLGVTDFWRMLQKEFGYPMARDALRMYLARKYPDLYSGERGK